MALWHAHCITSPRLLVLTLTGLPSLRLSHQHRAIMSFPTQWPFIHPYRHILLATPWPPHLRLRCLPTISLVPVQLWHSTCPQITRPCPTIYLHWGPQCRGSINMRCCRGWRFRGAGWCSIQREHHYYLLFHLSPHNRISFKFASFFAHRRAHERPPPHPHRMHPNYGHGHHIHVPQTMSSHPRQPEQRTAWSVSGAAQPGEGKLSYADDWILALCSSTGSWGSRLWHHILLQGTCTPTCPLTTLPPDCTTSPSWWEYNPEHACIH